MTGERRNGSTSSHYRQYIESYRIALLTGRNGTFYFLHPLFIAEFNDFTQDTTLVYGGFCYSFLGDWPYVINENCGAGGYFGFDLSVLTVYNVYWARRLFSRLSDTTKLLPMTATDWIIDGTVKYHWNEKYEKYTSIKYYGYPDLVLWEPSLPDFNHVSIFVNGINATFSLTGTYFPSDQGVLNNHVDAYISFTDTSVIGSWDENTGYYDHIGDLEVRFDLSNNRVTYFHVNEYQIFGPESYRTYEIKGEGVPIPFNQYRDEYCIFGADVKSCIGSDFYYLEVADETSSRTLISYECDETSVIAIRLSWQ